MNRTKDITSERFGQLVAIRPVGKIGAHARWEFRCDCGTVKELSAHNVRGEGPGKTRSCGCLRTKKGKSNG